MTVTLALGIPTINRLDILAANLDQYKKDWIGRNILIVDNGNQGIEVKKPIHVVVNPENRGVAGSWNQLCAALFSAGYTHAHIINDDIDMRTQPEALEAFIEANPADFYVGTQNWCSFIMPKATFREIGRFDDKFFPAYFEDNDYYRRLILAGKKIVRTELLDPVVYRNSMTIQKEPALNNLFMANQQYYIQKWGGTPGQETFTTPFNNPSPA